MMTEKALSAGAITQKEAEQLEDWIDASIESGLSVTVPSHLEKIFEICYLMNEQEGAKQ